MQIIHPSIIQDLVLYLWRFHSAVSLRVSALHSCEDSDRRWPPTSLCPTCWDASVEPWVVMDEAQRLAETKWGGFGRGGSWVTMEVDKRAWFWGERKVWIENIVMRCCQEVFKALVYRDSRLCKQIGSRNGSIRALGPTRDELISSTDVQHCLWQEKKQLQPRFLTMYLGLRWNHKTPTRYDSELNLNN